MTLLLVVEIYTKNYETGNKAINNKYSISTHNKTSLLSSLH